MLHAIRARALLGHHPERATDRLTMGITEVAHLLHRITTLLVSTDSP
ncbi:MAG: hypothetical protein ACRDQ4_10145 [Pseudonocardiaceae bacterium]